jgi:hypothetical protein
MPDRFLLPCSCGRSVYVYEGQAGRKAFCDCGRTLEVPSGREFDLLEPAAASSAYRPARRQYPPAALLGVAMISGGLVAAFLFWAWPHSSGAPASPAAMEEIADTVQGMSAKESIDLFSTIQREGLRADDAAEAKNASAVDNRTFPILLAIGIAAIGLLLTAAALSQPRDQG